jgi:hypothetical protein
MLRTIGCCAALILGLLLSLSLAAVPAGACEGAGCRTAATAKPLDLMKFMHRPTAAARAKARPAHIRSAAQHKHQTAAGQQPPDQLPVEAAAAFASQSNPQVQVVSFDEVNSIDRIADAVPAETVGAAISGDQNVQLIAAQDVNDIDRKAAGGRTHISWLQRIWSALGSALDALAAATRQLIG